MSVRVYKSTDAGASVLSGQVGKLTDILDACLVNGYNSQTITITRSGTTATATCTTHGFLTGQRLLISGAVQTDYNGEFTISNVAANTFDYTVANSPATPATGTITAKMAPAGFAIAYTGTNKRAYRAATGNRSYYRVEDNNDTASGAIYTKAVGYETMSTIDVGTNPFPNATQVSGGIVWCKSNTADATARPWMIIASDKFVYLWFDRASDSPASPAVYSFGEYTALNSYDDWHSLITGNTTAGTSSGNFLFTNLTQSGLYGLRSITNFGSAINTLYKRGWGQETNMQGWSLQYPDPITGDIPLTPMMIWETLPGSLDWVPRGYFPGCWIFGQTSTSFTQADTFSGKTGSELDGKTFIVWRFITSAGCAIETSQTW